MGFDFIVIAPLLPSHCGFPFVFGCGVSFLVSSSVFLSMIVQQLFVVPVFLQEGVSARPSTLPSWTNSESLILCNFNYFKVKEIFVINGYCIGQYRSSIFFIILCKISAYVILLKILCIMSYSALLSLFRYKTPLWPNFFITYDIAYWAKQAFLRIIEKIYIWRSI